MTSRSSFSVDGFREVFVKCAAWIVERMELGKELPETKLKLEQALHHLCHFSTSPDVDAVVGDFSRAGLFSVSDGGSIAWSEAASQLFYSQTGLQGTTATALRTLTDWRTYCQGVTMLPGNIFALHEGLGLTAINVEVSSVDVIDLLVEVGVLRELKHEGVNDRNYLINYPCSLDEWEQRLSSNVSHWPLQPALLAGLEHCDALESQALFWLTTMLDDRDYSSRGVLSAEGDCRSEGDDCHSPLNCQQMQDEIQDEILWEAEEKNQQVPYTEEEEQWYTARMEEMTCTEDSDSEFEVAWAQSERELEAKAQGCCGVKRKPENVQMAGCSAVGGGDAAKRTRLEGMARMASSSSGDDVDRMDMSCIVTSIATAVRDDL
jgi:hypothetical protein